MFQVANQRRSQPVTCTADQVWFIPEKSSSERARSLWMGFGFFHRLNFGIRPKAGRSLECEVYSPPRSLFIESSSWLKARMVLEVTLLFTRSSSALVIFSVMVLPLMAQVPRGIVLGDALESVLLMNPWEWGYGNCAMKWAVRAEGNSEFFHVTQSAPSQSALTIFALDSASGTGFSGVQDETPKANCH